MVHLLLILGSPLEIHDNLICNKDNLGSSRDTLLGRVVSLIYIKANPLSSLVNRLDKLVNLRYQANQLPSPLNHLVHQDNPRLCKDNPTPNRLNILGRWANLNLNQDNLLARWLNPNPLKDISMCLLNRACKWLLLPKLHSVFTPGWALDPSCSSNASWVSISTSLSNAAWPPRSVWSPKTLWFPAILGASSVCPIPKSSINGGESLSELRATVCCSYRSSW